MALSRAACLAQFCHYPLRVLAGANPIREASSHIVGSAQRSTGGALQNFFPGLRDDQTGNWLIAHEEPTRIRLHLRDSIKATPTDFRLPSHRIENEDVLEGPSAGDVEGLGKQD